MVVPLSSLEELIQEGKHVFEKEFKMVPEVVAMAHGGLNLIGEHTEYNEGFVFTMAIPMMTVIVGRKSQSRTIRLFTTAEDADPPRLTEFFAPLPQKPIEKGTPLWANYFKGVIQHFDGPKVGFDAVIVSNIPMRRGLSSSASMEMAAYTFLEELIDVRSDLQTKAKNCQRAEYLFTRFLSNLSDQMNLIYAKEGSGTLIDCRTFEVKNIAIPMDNATFLIIDFHCRVDYPKEMIKERKKLLDTISKMCKKSTLRDVTMNDMNELNSTGCIDQCMYMKARHVLLENERVMRAVRSLSDHNYEHFGCLMNESHESLKNDYQVTMSPEMDKLIDIVRNVEGVYGAKGIGGGYSGCLVALITESAMEDIIKKVKQKYSGNIDFYHVIPAGGPQSIKLKNTDSN